jgi:acyl-CoA thioesterase-2
LTLCIEENVLQELITLLELEEIEENIYRGQSQDLGWGTVFGGQVIGQALSAAYRTVSPDRRAHSLHGYFLRMGDVNKPIVYTVDCIRDGKSFNTRRVVAVQYGKAIFNMAASFQEQEEGFEHQIDSPSFPGPEGLASEMELAEANADRIPESIRKIVLCRKPIEIRPVKTMNPFAPQKIPPARQVWFKTIDRIPNDPAVHQYMLAYASDYELIPTALYPHGYSFWQPEIQIASLDHAMWFHREFRMDDWLLYVMHSPVAQGARALCRGDIYTRDGLLVASVAQEGLIRYNPPASDQAGRTNEKDLGKK